MGRWNHRQPYQRVVGAGKSAIFEQKKVLCPLCRRSIDFKGKKAFDPFLASPIIPGNPLSDFKGKNYPRILEGILSHPYWSQLSSDDPFLASPTIPENPLSVFTRGGGNFKSPCGSQFSSDCNCWQK